MHFHLIETAVGSVAALALPAAIIAMSGDQRQPIPPENLGIRLVRSGEALVARDWSRARTALHFLLPETPARSTP